LSENAEYHAAKEKQGFIEGRIQELESKLALAQVIDPTSMSGDVVRFGATVKIVNEDTDEESTYQIVGEDEANVKDGKISVTSPIARAMITKEVGDVFEVIALVLSDGRRGIENQALGLAERCAFLKPLSILTHHISHSKLVVTLPPKVQTRLVQYNLPDCDIAIGCGRQAIAPLLYLKTNHPQVMTVYVQDPRTDPSHFDLVIAPTHDELKGHNVQSMIGSPNRVTDERIVRETQNFANGLSKLSAPRVALLIGGNSKTHKLDNKAHQLHLDAALNLKIAGFSLLITVSRRTPEFARLAWRKFASENRHVWLHDGEGPNPYFAFLGGAEMILVTEDSTNMLTEACATGKPIFRLPMSGKAGKFQILYDALETRCGVTRYAGQLESADYPPLDETSRMAQIIWSRFEALKR